MKTRIAVYSQTRSFWGGSFQYAKAFVEALAGLDPDLFDVQVWHAGDEEWRVLCLRLNFIEHILGAYKFPPQFIPVAKKVLETLQHIREDDDAQRASLLASLLPFSEDAAIDAFRPHMVISPQMGCPRYVKDARHIGVIHDLMHRYEPHFPEVGTPTEIAARESLFRNMISRCDAILVDSRTGLCHVRECYPKVREEQLKILPFAAFDEVTQCVPRRPECYLPEKFLFYPAQFWLHKNHVGLAQAVAQLKIEIPDLVVVAAGNTKQNGYEPFMAILNSEGLGQHFILPGYLPVEELAWCYRHARALVMPTFFGPTNIPPLEAMALGCPMAVSGIYGMPEQCGNAALYFKSDDSADMAHVLHRLWTDDALCLDLKKKGLSRTHLYNISNFKKQVLRIVQGVCSAPYS